jgi:hypothetical protein
MILCIINSSRTNVLNLVVFIIKALVINLKFSLYIRLLSVKVYIAVFAKELIKVVYLSLVFCVYSLCI